jgi:hypothetical protein
LGSYRLCPFPSLKVKRREILPQASAPLQSVTNATPQALRRSLAFARRPPAPSEVSSPAASCQPWGATIPASSHLIRLRCALRVMLPLGALLPPWPAELVSSRLRSWGLPFEASLSLVVPYALSGAASLLELDQTPRRWPLLQGLSHHQGSRPELWGLARSLLRLPPWASAPPRFLAPRRGHSTRSLPEPSRAFAAWPQRPDHRRPRAATVRNAAALFRQRHDPLGVSHLVGHLDFSR